MKPDQAGDDKKGRGLFAQFLVDQLGERLEHLGDLFLVELGLFGQFTRETSALEMGLGRAAFSAGADFGGGLGALQLQETYGKVFAAMGELIDNAIDHGASGEGAFVAAQVYSGATSGRRGLEVAICDTGVGVLAHLRRNPKHADIPDSADALKQAFIPGVSGTTEDRGNGLSDLLSFLQFGGLARVHLRSGDGLATVTVGRRRRVEHTRSTAG